MVTFDCIYQTSLLQQFRNPSEVYMTKTSTKQNTYSPIQLFGRRLSHKSVKTYATLPIGIMGRNSLALID